MLKIVLFLFNFFKTKSAVLFSIYYVLCIKVTIIISTYFIYLSMSYLPPFPNTVPIAVCHGNDLDPTSHFNCPLVGQVPLSPPSHC